MKRLTFTHAANLGRLYGDLISAIPSLRPVAAPGGPIPGALVAAFQVEGDTAHVTLTVPDAADETAIAAVVAAHDSTPDLPLPQPDYGTDEPDRDAIIAGVVQLRAYLALPSPTAVQSAAALKILVRGFLFVLRRLL